MFAEYKEPWQRRLIGLWAAWDVWYAIPGVPGFAEFDLRCNTALLEL